MVLPFALVILGCRYLFLFLSLCVASCSPYLHLAQSALSTVRWFNLGDDFALASHSNVTMVNVTMVRANRLLLRRIWDPGIHGLTRLAAATSPFMAIPVPLAMMTSLFMVFQFLAQAQETTFDPGIASCAIVGLYIGSLEVFPLPLSRRDGMVF